MKKCLACHEWVCKEMQTCQPCIAASPMYSMLHAFTKERMKKKKRHYIHNQEEILKRKWEQPYYSEHCNKVIPLSHDQII